MKLIWIENHRISVKEYYETEYEGHVCTPDEITKNKHDSGFLYICPPAEKLSLFRNMMYYPHQDIGLRIRPNLDDPLTVEYIKKEANNF